MAVAVDRHSSTYITETVELWVVDAATSTVRKIPAPPGVPSARALCASGSSLFAVTLTFSVPTPTERSHVESLQAFALYGEVWRPVATHKPTENIFAGEFGAMCADAETAFFVLRNGLIGDERTHRIYPLVRDGRPNSDVPFDPGGTPIFHHEGSSTLVVTVLTEDEIGGESDAIALAYAAGSWSRRAEVPQSPDRPTSQFVEADGRLFDVGPISQHERGNAQMKPVAEG